MFKPFQQGCESRKCLISSKVVGKGSAKRHCRVVCVITSMVLLLMSAAWPITVASSVCRIS